LLAPGPAGGGTALDAALVVEQLARALAPLPYLGTVLADRLLTAVGSARADDLPLAVGFDGSLSAPGTEVAWDATGARGVVGLERRGVITGAVGETLGSADLTREVSAVVNRRQVGELGDDDRSRWLALALALLSADLLGVMEGALETAVGHARERKQFGRPVGSFQAVQHLCADQLVRVEAARSVVWHAAWAVDELDPSDAVLAGRVAKAWTARAAIDVCEAAIQVWGGLGLTWECAAHVYLRRAHLDRRTLGDERSQLASIADARLGAHR